MQKTDYLSPMAYVFDVVTEGVLCLSPGVGDYEGGNAGSLGDNDFGNF